MVTRRLAESSRRTMDNSRQNYKFQEVSSAYLNSLSDVEIQSQNKIDKQQ
jgi:hypothetical protein